MAIFTRSTPIHISCCSTACFLFHYGIMTTNWFTLYNKSFNTLSPVSSIQGRLNCKRNTDNNVWFELYAILTNFKHNSPISSWCCGEAGTCQCTGLTSQELCRSAYGSFAAPPGQQTCIDLNQGLGLHCQSLMFVFSFGTVNKGLLLPGISCSTG